MDIQPIHNLDLSSNYNEIVQLLTKTIKTAPIFNFFQINSFHLFQNSDLYQHLTESFTPRLYGIDSNNLSPPVQLSKGLQLTFFQIFFIWANEIYPTLSPTPTRPPPITAKPSDPKLFEDDKYQLPQHDIYHYFHHFLNQLYLIESSLLQERLLQIESVINTYITSHPGKYNTNGGTVDDDNDMSDIAHVKETMNDENSTAVDNSENATAQTNPPAANQNPQINHHTHTFPSPYPTLPTINHFLLPWSSSVSRLSTPVLNLKIEDLLQARQSIIVSQFTEFAFHLWNSPLDYFNQIDIFKSRCGGLTGDQIEHRNNENAQSEQNEQNEQNETKNVSKLTVQSKDLAYLIKTSFLPTEIDTHSDYLITRDPTLSDEVFHEVKTTIPVVRDLLIPVIISLSKTTPGSSSGSSSGSGSTEKKKQLQFFWKEINTNFLSPINLARLPVHLYRYIYTSNDSKPLFTESSLGTLANWRKQFVATFTKFQRFNLFTECVEGYAKVYTEIQNSFLNLNFNYHQIYISLSHDIKTVALNNQPWRLDLVCTCGSDGCSLTSPTDKTAQTLPSSPQRIFNPYYRHNHIVSQLLPLILSQGLTDGNITTGSQPNSLSLEKITCPVVYIFVELYLNALRSLRTNLLQLVGSFDLDTTKVLDMLIVIYLHLVYSNASANEFSTALLTPDSAKTLHNNDQNEQHEQHDVPKNTTTSPLADSFQPDLILSLLTPVSPTLGDSLDPLLTYAAQPAFQLVQSPMTLLFAGLLPLFQKDVIVSTLGSQLSLRISQTNSPITPSDQSDAGTQQGSNLWYFHEKTTFWVPLIYLTSLLIRYKYISYQSILFYIDPNGTSLTSLSQKYNAIQQGVKKVITKMSSISLSGSSNELSLDTKLLAQLDSFDALVFTQNTPGQLGPSLPQTVTERTSEPILLIFSTCFALHSYDYILNLFFNFTNIHLERHYLLSGSGYQTAEQLSVMGLQRSVSYTVPYSLDYDKYFAQILSSECHYERPFNVTKNPWTTPNKKECTESERVIAAYPFLPLYNRSNDQLLLQILEPQWLEEQTNKPDSHDKQNANSDGGLSSKMTDDDDDLMAMMMMMGGGGSMDGDDEQDGSDITKKQTLSTHLPYYPYLTLNPLSIPLQTENDSVVNGKVLKTAIHDLDMLYLQLAQCGDLVVLFNHESIERHTPFYLNIPPATTQIRTQTDGTASSNAMNDGQNATKEKEYQQECTQYHRLGLQAQQLPHRYLTPQLYRQTTGLFTPQIATNNPFVNTLIMRLQGFLMVSKPLTLHLTQHYIKPSSGPFTHEPTLSLETTKMVFQQLLALLSPLKGYLSISMNLFHETCQFINLLLHHIRALLLINPTEQNPPSRQTRQTTLSYASSIHKNPLSLYNINPMNSGKKLDRYDDRYDDQYGEESTRSNSINLYEIFTIISFIIFPAHTQLPGSVVNNNALWSILQHFDYSDRFALYSIQEQHKAQSSLFSTLYEQFCLTQYVQRTKYCRKRLANDNVQEVSIMASKFMLPAPTIALELLVENLKNFPNFAQPMLELCANCSPIIHDILTYLITQNIYTLFNQQQSHNSAFDVTMNTSTVDKLSQFYVSLYSQYPSVVDIYPYIDMLLIFSHKSKLTVSNVITNLFQTTSNIPLDEDVQIDKIKYQTSSFFLSYLSQSTTFTFEKAAQNTALVTALFHHYNAPYSYIINPREPKTILPDYTNVSFLKTFHTPTPLTTTNVYINPINQYTSNIPIFGDSNLKSGQQNNSKSVSASSLHIIPPRRNIQFHNIAHIHPTSANTISYSSRTFLHYNQLHSALTFPTLLTSPPHSHLNLTQPNPLIPYRIIHTPSQNKKNQTKQDLTTPSLYGSSLLFPPQALPLSTALTNFGLIYTLLLQQISIYNAILPTTTSDSYSAHLTLVDKYFNNIYSLRQFLSFYSDFSQVLTFSPNRKFSIVKTIHELYLQHKVDNLGLILHVYRNVMYKYPQVLQYSIVMPSAMKECNVVNTLSKQQREYLQAIHLYQGFLMNFDHQNTNDQSHFSVSSVQTASKQLLNLNSSIIKHIPTSFVHFIDLYYNNYLYARQHDEVSTTIDFIKTTLLSPPPPQQSSPPYTNFNLPPKQLPSTLNGLIPVHFVHIFAFFWYHHAPHIHHEVPFLVPSLASLQQHEINTATRQVTSDIGVTEEGQNMDQTPTQPKPLHIQHRSRLLKTAEIASGLYRPLLTQLVNKRSELAKVILEFSNDAQNNNNKPHTTLTPSQIQAKIEAEFEYDIVDGQITECMQQIENQINLFLQTRHHFNTMSAIPFPQTFKASIRIDPTNKAIDKSGSVSPQIEQDDKKHKLGENQEKKIETDDKNVENVEDIENDDKSIEDGHELENILVEKSPVEPLTPTAMTDQDSTMGGIDTTQLSPLPEAQSLLNTEKDMIIEPSNQIDVPPTPQFEIIVLNSRSDFDNLRPAQQIEFLSLPHNVVFTNLFTTTLLTSAILPRIILSSTDAYYCAHFIHSLRKSKFLGFSFVHFMDSCLTQLDILLTSATKNESQRIAIFFNELFYFAPALHLGVKNPFTQTWFPAPKSTSSSDNRQSPPINTNITTSAIVSEMRSEFASFPLTGLFDPVLLAPPPPLQSPQSKPLHSNGRININNILHLVKKWYSRVRGLVLTHCDDLIKTFSTTPDPNIKNNTYTTPDLTDNERFTLRECKEKIILSWLVVLSKFGDIFPLFSDLGAQILTKLQALLALYDPRKGPQTATNTSSQMYSVLNSVTNMLNAQQRQSMWFMVPDMNKGSTIDDKNKDNKEKDKRTAPPAEDVAKTPVSSLPPKTSPMSSNITSNTPTVAVGGNYPFRSSEKSQKNPEDDKKSLPKEFEKKTAFRDNKITTEAPLSEGKGLNPAIPTKTITTIGTAVIGSTQSKPGFKTEKNESKIASSTNAAPIFTKMEKQTEKSDLSKPLGSSHLNITSSAITHGGVNPLKRKQPESSPPIPLQQHQTHTQNPTASTPLHASRMPKPLNLPPLPSVAAETSDTGATKGENDDDGEDNDGEQQQIGSSTGYSRGRYQQNKNSRRFDNQNVDQDDRRRHHYNPRQPRH